MLDNLIGKNKIETLIQFALQCIAGYESNPTVGVASSRIFEKTRSQV